MCKLSAAISRNVDIYIEQYRARKELWEPSILRHVPSADMHTKPTKHRTKQVW